MTPAVSAANPRRCKSKAQKRGRMTVFFCLWPHSTILASTFSSGHPPQLRRTRLHNTQDESDVQRCHQTSANGLKLLLQYEVWEKLLAQLSVRDSLSACGILRGAAPRCAPCAGLGCPRDDVKLRPHAAKGGRFWRRGAPAAESIKDVDDGSAKNLMISDARAHRKQCF